MKGAASRAGAGDNAGEWGRYGEKLFYMRAEKLSAESVSNCIRRQLYRYLNFYRTYHQIVGAVSPQFRGIVYNV